MNNEILLKTADAIEQSSVPDLVFDMTTFGQKTYSDYGETECGTAGCIAGWIVAINDGTEAYHEYIKDIGERFPPRMPKTIPERAIEILGVTKDDKNYLLLDNLFIGEAADGDGLSVSLWRVTPEIAANVMRQLAMTGTYIWPEEICDEED